MDPTTVQLALVLFSQGLKAWAEFGERAARGEVTNEEVDAMAARMGMNIEGLRADIAAAKAEGR